MLKDDEGKWTLAMKAENMPVLSVHPSKEDVSLYFDVIKNDHDDAHVQEFRTQMAQKYYSLFSKNQVPPVNIFKSDASQEALDLISKVNAFKTKDSKILLVATIGDEKQKPRYVNQEQWQRLWLADDKQDYKKHLAAALYSDVLARKLEETKKRLLQKLMAQNFMRSRNVGITSKMRNAVIRQSRKRRNGRKRKPRRMRPKQKPRL